TGRWTRSSSSRPAGMRWRSPVLLPAALALADVQSEERDRGEGHNAYRGRPVPGQQGDDVAPYRVKTVVRCGDVQPAEPHRRDEGGCERPGGGRAEEAADEAWRGGAPGLVIPQPCARPPRILQVSPGGQRARRPRAPGSRHSARKDTPRD